MNRILVIEDDWITRESIADLLRLEHFDVACAGDGVEGVRLARETSPDIILCDITLPGVDGYGVLRELRSDGRMATVPFIFLTGRVSNAEVRLGMQSGADDYLCKPVFKDELLAAVSARLARSRSSVSLFNHRMEALSADIGKAVTHELLTPLSGIFGCGQLLEQYPGCVTDPEIQNLVGMIMTSAGRLHDTLRHLLEYVGLRTLQDQPGRVEELRRNPPEDAAPTLRMAANNLARAANRTPDLKLALESHSLRIPSAYLYLAASQLLSNAFKFSDPGSEVAVTFAAENGVARLSVADRGRGMSPEEIEAIGPFRQFRREKFEQQGLGLGLEIVRLTAAIFGGELEVVSEASGGTVATVRNLV